MTVSLSTHITDQLPTHLDPEAGSGNTLKAMNIGLIVSDGFSLSALAAVSNTLRLANGCSSAGLFGVRLISPDAMVTSETGIKLSTAIRLDDLQPLDFDCLWVCGSDQGEYRIHTALTVKLHEAAAHGCAIGGVASGCHALLQAGLLDDRACAVSRSFIDRWQSGFAKVEFVPEAFRIDRHSMTCASSGDALGMMLTFIAMHGGPELAGAVGRGLPQREDAASFGAITLPFDSKTVAPSALMRAVQLMRWNIEKPLEVEQLALDTGISRRHLERLFKKNFNATPGRYYLDLRLRHARQLLMHTDVSLTQIALVSGFSTCSHFYSRFKAAFGDAPSQFRDKACAMPRRFSLV